MTFDRENKFFNLCFAKNTAARIQGSGEHHLAPVGKNGQGESFLRATERRTG